jgi:hypothetical protein
MERAAITAGKAQFMHDIPIPGAPATGDVQAIAKIQKAQPRLFLPQSHAKSGRPVLDFTDDLAGRFDFIALICGHRTHDGCKVRLQKE